MVNIHRDFNENSPIKCSIPQLWDQFSKYFNVDKLEELVNNVYSLTSSGLELNFFFFDRILGT